MAWSRCSSNRDSNRSSNSNKSLVAVALLLLTITSFGIIAATASSDDTSSTEYWRPRLHYAKPRNWINDPNGLVFDSSTQLYHLFSQYNPWGETWGNMSWGHAVSTDLVHWKELPVAIYTGPQVSIFSGSAVIDRNTSGLCGARTECLVCIWAGDGLGKQTINVAYSVDDAYTVYDKYVNNPVIDVGSDNFRDPAVFWYSLSLRTRLASPPIGASDAVSAADGYWVAVIAHSDLRRVDIYRSSNLLNWTLMSTFGVNTANEWECPDLFPLDGKWVLTVSVEGSPSVYVVGDFNGTHFSSAPIDAQLMLPLDSGIDYYASVSYNPLPGGRVVGIAWMLANWLGYEVPTDPWRGSYTIPREYHLRPFPPNQSLTYRLYSLPVMELAAYRAVQYEMHSELTVNASTAVEVMESTMYPGGTLLQLDACFAYPAGGAPAVFGFYFRADDVLSEYTRVALNMSSSGSSNALAISIDRTHSGVVNFSSNFPSVHTVPLALDEMMAVDDEQLCISVLLDMCSIEVFVQRGAAVLSELIFPSPLVNNTRVVFFVDEGEVAVQTLSVWDMMDPVSDATHDARVVDA